MRLRKAETVKILITGSREWPNDQSTINMVTRALFHVLRTEQPEVAVSFIVGDCPTGADWALRQMADEAGLEYDMRIARWDLYDKAAGPIRNQEMVDTRPDLVLAFPKPGSRNKGTLGCMLMAKRADIQVIDGYSLSTST